MVLRRQVHALSQAAAHAPARRLMEREGDADPLD